MKDLFHNLKQMELDTAYSFSPENAKRNQKRLLAQKLQQLGDSLHALAEAQGRLLEDPYFQLGSQQPLPKGRGLYKPLH